jgi:ABC-type branched-subunit amino acid transport system ATPase component
VAEQNLAATLALTQRVYIINNGELSQRRFTGSNSNP